MGPLQADQCGVPCWRQLLEYCIKHGSREQVQAAQQAATQADSNMTAEEATALAAGLKALQS